MFELHMSMIFVANPHAQLVCPEYIWKAIWKVTTIKLNEFKFLLQSGADGKSDVVSARDAYQHGITTIPQSYAE